jgi:hypothetical protein
MGEVCDPSVERLEGPLSMLSVGPCRVGHLLLFALWVTIGWPSSLTTSDVLFLIPSPWIAQVWFPLLVCSITLLAVILTRRHGAPAPAAIGPHAGARARRTC